MDGKVGILMCNLKGRMDKGGHYDVEMKGWMMAKVQTLHINMGT